MTPKRFYGFTLIELVVTVAIAGIVLGVAIPSFNSMMASNRLTTCANQLVTALNLARSEAVKRGVQVTVRRKGNTSKQWESGWDIFVDSDNSNTFTNGDTALKTYDALPSGFTLRTGSSTYQDYAAYMSTGLSKSTAGDTFRLCDSSANTANSRTIAINMLGRLTVSVGTAASCP